MQFRRSLFSNRVAASTLVSTLGRKVLAAVVLTASLTGAAQAQVYTNVSVGGAFAPGVFGQISFSNSPPPPVWNAHPVTYGQRVYGATPVYLHVPQVAHRDWGRHCARYGACGRPVHFVRVEQHNRWWEHRGAYPRGPGYYRQPDAYPYSRREEHRNEQRRDYRDYRVERNGEQRQAYRDGRFDNPGYPRHESRRGEW